LARARGREGACGAPSGGSMKKNEKLSHALVRSWRAPRPAGACAGYPYMGRGCMPARNLRANAFARAAMTKIDILARSASHRRVYTVGDGGARTSYTIFSGVRQQRVTWCSNVGGKGRKPCGSLRSLLWTVYVTGFQVDGHGPPFASSRVCERPARGAPRFVRQNAPGATARSAHTRFSGPVRAAPSRRGRAAPARSAHRP
jgi:hypothetical protein